MMAHSTRAGRLNDDNIAYSQSPSSDNDKFENANFTDNISTKDVAQPNLLETTSYSSNISIDINNSNTSIVDKDESMKCLSSFLTTDLRNSQQSSKVTLSLPNNLHFTRRIQHYSKLNPYNGTTGDSITYDMEVEKSNDNDSVYLERFPPHVKQYKPRILFIAIYMLLSVINGRFMAPFLKHECNFSPKLIGICFSVKLVMAIPAMLYGGHYADKLERLHPGYGRAYIVMIGVVFGTVLFLFHSMKRIFPNVSMFDTIAWHFTLQAAAGLTASFVYPVLDGVCLDYLKNYSNDRMSPQRDMASRTSDPNDLILNERSDSDCQKDYGHERVYGAYSWAATNMIMSLLLDTKYGFAVTYPMAIVGSIVTIYILYIYSEDSVRAANYRNNAHLTTTVSEQHRYSGSTNIDMSDVVVANTNGCVEPEQMIAGMDSKPSLICIEKDECVKDLNTHLSVNENRIQFSALIRIVLFSTSLALPFFVSFIMLSSGQAIVDNLVFLFFEFLGSSYKVMGFTVLLTVAFEIPIFHVAPKLLKYFGSSTLLLIAAFCYVIRVIGYTLIPQGQMYYILFLEPLHGITFACASTASIDYITELIPTGYEASGQGILYLLRGAGTVFGLMYGGWANETLGPRAMYRIAAIIILVTSAVYSVVFVQYTASEKAAVYHNQLNTGDADGMTCELSKSFQGTKQHLHGDQYSACSSTEIMNESDEEASTLSEENVSSLSQNV